MDGGHWIVLGLGVFTFLLSQVERVVKIVQGTTRTETQAEKGASAEAKSHDHETRLTLLEKDNRDLHEQKAKLEETLSERTHNLRDRCTAMDAKILLLEAANQRTEQTLAAGMTSLGKGLSDVAKVVESFRDQLSLGDRVSRLEGRDSTTPQEVRRTRTKQ